MIDTQVINIKIIYTTDFNYATKIDMKVLDELKNYGYKFTIVDWKEELKIDHHPSIEEINELYLKKDEKLFKLYKKIEYLSNSHDVLIATQNNVYHPNFIKSLKNIYTVYSSGDDPDSSEICSKPYVDSYDHMFAVGVNFDKKTKITEKFLEWGAKKADWWPLGFREDTYNPQLTVDDIFSKKRDIDLAFVGDIISRRERLTKIKRSFPQMKLYSNDLGMFKIKFLINMYYTFKSKRYTWAVKLPHEQMTPLYQNLKIGINDHNISGPSNIRMYQLPANGVMQICDCSEGLDQVFKVGKEVVVYETIPEAIELIEYYLNNEEERKKIAAAGFKRTLKDYNKKETFIKALRIIEQSLN